MKTLPIFVLALAATAAQAQVATLTLLPNRLGTSMAPGYTAVAMSADGKTVLLDSLTGEYFEANGMLGHRFDFWTATGGLTPGAAFEAGGMSADGNVVGGARWTRAYRYSTTSGSEPLPLFPNMGSSYVDPYQRSVRGGIVSGDGRTVFGRLLVLTPIAGTPYIDYGGYTVRWTPSGIEAFAGANWSEITAASYDGLVAVGEAGLQAVRWTAAGGTVPLGNPAGTNSSSATAVSADGRLAFGRAERSGDNQGKVPPIHVGFRWSAATGSVALDGLGRVAAATPDGRFAIGSSYTYEFHWNSTNGPGGIGGPIRPQPKTGSWWRRPATKIWDARGGVLDLRAMMAAQGLPSYQGAGSGDNWEELDIVGVAYDKGVLTVVSRDGYGGFQGFRATLAYDPAPLTVMTSLGDLRGSPTKVPVTVELRRQGTLEVVQRATVFPGADWKAVVNAPAAGTYDASISAPRFLRRTLKNLTLAGGAAAFSASLFNGDADGDGAVTAADGKRVESALGKAEGQPGFDPMSDLDGNGVVNSLDRSIVTVRMGKVADR